MQINIRLTEDEYAAIAVQAARVGMNPTAYMSDVARHETSEQRSMTHADLILARREAVAQITRERVVDPLPCCLDPAHVNGDECYEDDL